MIHGREHIGSAIERQVLLDHQLEMVSSTSITLRAFPSSVRMGCMSHGKGILKFSRSLKQFETATSLPPNTAIEAATS